VKPIPELPIRVATQNDGPFREVLHVIDVSVSGLSLESPVFRGAGVGDKLKLFVSLGPEFAEEFTIDAVRRWCANERAGVELVDPPADAAKAVAKYVSELLERGARA
jgi:hypothetical protein